MLRTLNWTGILFGTGAGLLAGLALSALAAAAGSPAALLALIELASFVVAGFVAGRLSLTNRVPSGGFAALILSFGLATVSIAAGADVPGVGVLFSGLLALGSGSLGGFLAERSRREKS